MEADLLILDGAKKSLAYAIHTAKSSKETVFLTFVISRLNVRSLDWNALGQEGWGILANEIEGWKYVGDVQGGRRNGSGIMTYADGTSYAGGWFNDERDGYGILSKTGEGGAVIEEGIYVENLLRNDGVVIDTTVVKNGSVVGFAKIALRSRDSVSGHVDKIARVLGWRSGQKYRIKLEASSGAFEPHSVLVNGPLIDSSRGHQCGDLRMASGQRERRDQDQG